MSLNLMMCLFGIEPDAALQNVVEVAILRATAVFKNHLSVREVINIRYDLYFNGA